MLTASVPLVSVLTTTADLAPARSTHSSETDEQYRERVAERLGIATDEMGPVYTVWRPIRNRVRVSRRTAVLSLYRPVRSRGRDEELRPSPIPKDLARRSPYQLCWPSAVVGTHHVCGEASVAPLTVVDLNRF